MTITVEWRSSLSNIPTYKPAKKSSSSSTCPTRKHAAGLFSSPCSLFVSAVPRLRPYSTSLKIRNLRLAAPWQGTGHASYPPERSSFSYYSLVAQASFPRISYFLLRCSWRTWLSRSHSYEMNGERGLEWRRRPAGSPYCCFQRTEIASSRRQRPR